MFGCTINNFSVTIRDALNKSWSDINPVVWEYTLGSNHLQKRKVHTTQTHGRHDIIRMQVDFHLFEQFFNLVRASSFLNRVKSPHSAHDGHRNFIRRLSQTVAYTRCSWPSRAILAHHFVGIVIHEVKAIFTGRETSTRVHNLHGKCRCIDKRFNG